MNLGNFHRTAQVSKRQVFENIPVSIRSQGGSAEIGYRIIKNLWIAAGYSFNKYDADLAGDGYQGQGPYLRLRVKFGETAFKDLREALASAESSANTSAR